MLTHGKVEGATDKPLICDRPNLLYGSYEYWYEVVTTLVAHGNYIAIISNRDTDGTPLQVVPVHPSAVNMTIENGLPVYRIADHRYGWRDVVHVRGLTTPGNRWGIGVLEAARRSLLAAYDEQTRHSQNLQHGGPNVVIQLDTPTIPVQDELDRIHSQWVTKYDRGAREPIVLPKTIAVQPATWSPEEMDFLASRAHTIGEIALMFFLDPSAAGASIANGGSITYANLTDRQLSRLVDCYARWIHLIEDAWSDLLPPGQRFQANVESLLRMSPKERMEVHLLAQQAGIETVDESRAIEGKPPRIVDDTTNDLGEAA